MTKTISPHLLCQRKWQNFRYLAFFPTLFSNFGRNAASPSVHLFTGKKKKYVQIITNLENAIQNIFCNSTQYSFQDFGKNASLVFLIITESLRVKFPHATEIPIVL